jgi:hypothetical protein
MKPDTPTSQLQLDFEPAPRETFAVGRLDRRTNELQIVRPSGDAPIPGPWSLKAVVRGRGPELRLVR